MKKIYFLLAIFFASAISFSQSVTQPAGNGANSPSSGCLACAGEVWNNELNITALDGVAADVSLMQNGFCFQSSCFTSRSLAADQFGFAVPSTSTVTGIEVNITREAKDTNMVRDSMVQLTNSGIPAGAIKKNTNFWDTIVQTITYGSSTDLWGSTSSYWTPAVINGNTIGVNLKILNTATVSTQSNAVDFITMTIYYSTTMGIVESQTSVPNAFDVHQQQGQIALSFFPTGRAENVFTLLDMEGRIVLKHEMGTLPSARQQMSLPAEHLPRGVYLARYTCGGQIACKKIVLN